MQVSHFVEAESSVVKGFEMFTVQLYGPGVVLYCLLVLPEFSVGEPSVVVEVSF